MSRAAPAGLSHVPVLLDEAMAALEPRAGGLYVDATFGAGGYARALLDRGATVIAIDRDPAAVRAGAALAASSGGRLQIAEARFGELDAVARRLGAEAADGVVFDIGVSSMQLDEAARGFSLRVRRSSRHAHGGGGRSAADILCDEDEATIADILFHFGEERAARRIARAIVADRRGEAVHLDARACRAYRPRRPGAARRIDPSGDARLPGPAHRRQRRARRTRARPRRRRAAPQARRAPRGRHLPLARGPHRQAVLRGPLGPRARGLAPLAGRAGAKPQPTFEVPRGQPIEPGEAEAAANPRARSAKLRFGLRTGAPAQRMDEAIEALARLPARRGR